MPTKFNPSKTSSNNCTPHGLPSRRDAENPSGLASWMCFDLSDWNISIWHYETRRFERSSISRVLRTSGSITDLSVAAISPAPTRFFLEKVQTTHSHNPGNWIQKKTIVSIHCRLHHLTKTDAHTLTECSNIQTLGQCSSSEKTNHL